MAAKGKKVFSLFGSIVLDGIETVNKQLNAVDKEALKAQKTLEKFGKNIEAIGLQLTKITAPIAAIGAGIAALALKTGDYADELLDLADITALSTNTLQELENVSRKAGVSFDGLTGTISKLSNQIPEIAKGSGPAYEALSKLGISVFDTSGHVRDMNYLFPEMLNKLRDVNNVTERNALAQDIFGKSLSDIAPVLSMTTAEFEAARKESYELGLVMSGESLNAANDFKIEVESLKAQFTAMTRTVASEFIPIFTGTIIPMVKSTLIPAFAKLMGVIKSVTDWFSNLTPASQKTLLVFTGVITILGPLLVIIGKIIVITRAWTTAILAANVAMAANPIGAITLGIAGLVAGIWAAVDAYNNLKIAKENSEKSEEIKRLSELMLKFYDLKKVNIELAAEQEKLRKANDKAFDPQKLKDYLAIAEAYTGRIKEIQRKVNPVAAAQQEAGGSTGSGTVTAGGSPDIPVFTIVDPAIEEEKKQLESLAKERERMNGEYVDRLSALTETELQQLDRRKNAEIEYAKKVGMSKDELKAIEVVYALEKQKIEEDSDLKSNEKLEAFTEHKLKLEQQWTDAVLQQSGDRFAILENERQKALADEELTEAARANIQIYYDDLVAEEHKKNAEKKKQQIIDGANMAIGAVQDVFNLVSMANQNEQILLDQKTQKEIANINASQMTAKQKEDAIAKINIDADKKKTELARKQAKQEKAAAIFSIIINTAMAISKGFAQLGPIAGAVAAVIMGVLGAAQIAMVAAKPLPMAKGGLAKSRDGGVNAVIAEAGQDELVLPMKTGVGILADKLMEKISSVVMPDLNGMGNLAVAGAGGGSTNESNRNSRYETHWHIGTLIANDQGIKELERRQKQYRIAEAQRNGE